MPSNHQIDAIFRGKLDHHETPPPFRMWDQMESELPHPIAPLTYKMGYFLSGVAVTLLLLGVAWYFNATILPYSSTHTIQPLDTNATVFKTKWIDQFQTNAAAVQTTVGCSRVENKEQIRETYPVMEFDPKNRKETIVGHQQEKQLLKQTNTFSAKTVQQTKTSFEEVPKVKVKVKGSKESIVFFPTKTPKTAINVTEHKDNFVVIEREKKPAERTDGEVKQTKKKNRSNIIASKQIAKHPPKQDQDLLLKSNQLVFLLPKIIPNLTNKTVITPTILPVITDLLVAKKEESFLQEVAVRTKLPLPTALTAKKAVIESIVKKEQGLTIRKTKWVHPLLTKEQIVNDFVVREEKSLMTWMNKLIDTLLIKEQTVNNAIVVKEENTLKRTKASKLVDRLLIKEPITNVAEIKPITIVANPIRVERPTKLVLPQINMPIGLYVGTFGVLNNTWILSPEALAKNLDGNLVHKLDFGTAYGLSGGFDFTAHVGIQLEWVIRSTQGQQFDNFRPSTQVYKSPPVTSQVNLSYTQVPILLKYRFHRLSSRTKQPISISTALGLQYSHLKSFSSEITSSSFNKDVMQVHNWGWVGGVDMEVYITPNYFVSVGLRGSITSAGKTLRPTNQTTNHVLMGIRLGMNYRISR